LCPDRRDDGGLALSAARRILRPGSAVGRGFLTLGAGEALARIIAFGAAVYLARQLGPEVYGSVVLATTILLYGARIVDCGVDLLGVADVARDPAQLPALLPSLLGARLLVALALTSGLLVVGLAVLPPPGGLVLALYGFTLLPFALGAGWAQLGLRQVGIVSISRVATEGFAALLIVVLVRSPEDVARAPLAQLIGDGLGAFLLLRLLPRPAIRLRAILRFDAVVSLYRRSLPLVLHALLGLVIFNSDFFFLRIYRDSATVGYYAAAYALVSFFLNVGNSYALSLLPVIAQAAGDPTRQRHLYHGALAQVGAGAVPIAVGGMLVADRLVAAVFGGAYLPSVVPLQILCWTIPVALFRGVAQSVLVAHGRQDRLLTTTAWAAAGNLGLNVALIPVWGMTGAAIATFTSASLRLVMMLWFIRAGGLPFPSVRRFWRTLVAAGCMSAMVVAVRLPSVWLSIALGGVVYLLALYLVGGIRLHRMSLPELTV
jgi:O-antigen/teichoic acid export membrane protein